MANHHHHHHHHQSDAHRDPQAADAPLDAANQSLADALRASFSVLKLIMLVLVVLFLLSGVQFIDDREEAVVLRFGDFVDGARARSPGPSVALPYPIDETLRVPVRQDNVVKIDDHFLALREEEKDRPLSQVRRSTLDPTKDGALMTRDNGLVHVRWRLVYRIEDLVSFVTRVADGGTANAETLIRSILDNAAIHVAASEYTAEEITRNKANEMANRVRILVNERLEELGTGITVVTLEPDPTVPVATLAAFQAVSSAENKKQKLIREAQRERDEILNTCAGEAYPQIVAALDALQSAERAGDSEAAAAHRVELDRLIEFSSGGVTRAVVFEAKSYYTEAVQGIQADEEEYNALLDEYLRTPELLFGRLWADTKRRIFAHEQVHKWVLPPGQKELRILLGPDPKQRMLDEMKAIERGER